MHPAAGQQPARRRLPLFPLHTVLLPGTHLPLHIFEPRYRQLTADLMAGAHTDQEFGIVAIRNALINDVTDTDQIYPIGCAARLREAVPHDDGRYDIVVTGSRRFRIAALAESSTPYLTATVDWLADAPEAPGPEGGAVAAAARAAHERYCERAWSDDDWSPPEPDVPTDQLAYLLAEDCLLPLPDRQSLLAEPDPSRRLHLIGALLTREAGFLSALSAVPPAHHDLGTFDAASTLN